MPRRSPTLVFAGIGGALAAARIAGLVPPGPPPPAWAAPAAAVVGAAAVGLAAWSVRALGAFDGENPVESGPFRRSRHPMYVAMLGIVLAAALLTFEPAVALAIPLLALALDRLVVAPEERELEAAFGEAYRAYARRVRRWL